MRSALLRRLVKALMPSGVPETSSGICQVFIRVRIHLMHWSSTMLSSGESSPLLRLRRRSTVGSLKKFWISSRCSNPKKWLEATWRHSSSI
ncbi:hypothetical protein D3C86_1884960 [compost metagenome]